MARLTIKNQGGYVVDVMISVDLDGITKKTLAVGQSVTVHAEPSKTFNDGNAAVGAFGIVNVPNTRTVENHWRVNANVQGSQLGSRDSEVNLSYYSQVEKDTTIRLRGTTCKPYSKISMP